MNVKLYSSVISIHPQLATSSSPEVENATAKKRELRQVEDKSTFQRAVHPAKGARFHQ